MKIISNVSHEPNRSKTVIGSSLRNPEEYGKKNHRRKPEKLSEKKKSHLIVFKGRIFNRITLYIIKFTREQLFGARIYEKQANIEVSTVKNSHTSRKRIVCTTWNG